MGFITVHCQDTDGAVKVATNSGKLSSGYQDSARQSTVLRSARSARGNRPENLGRQRAGRATDFASFRAKKEPKCSFRLFGKDLATTYSRGSYTTTTIGKTVFDGRVRDGIGSDHSFMVTKNLKSEGRSQHSNVPHRLLLTI